MTLREVWLHLQVTVLRTVIVVALAGTLWQLNDFPGGAR